MKPSLCFVAVVMLFGLVPRPGEALTWEVYGYVFPTEKPNGMNSSYVWSRGLHQLAVTHVKLIDSIIPFRFKIASGEVKYEGASMDNCSTAWSWSWTENYFQECRTYAIQSFCESGVWSATVKGRLDIHPQGGIKFTATPPKLLNCSCT